MAVYIDNLNAGFGRMVMCHMIADSPAELLEMADKIGVDRKWLQDAGTPYEHFDVCRSKKAAAIKLGAIPISWRMLGKILRGRPGHYRYTDEAMKENELYKIILS